MPNLLPGDFVVICGWWYEIALIYDLTWTDGEWDVEFVDTIGSFHHWNSGEDGGYAVRREDTYECTGPHSYAD